MPQVAIINYGYGNLHSIAKAFEKVRHMHHATVTLSDQVADIKKASHIVLPGVGAFADCMKGLNSFPELKAAVCEAVLEDKKPFLGICVGMQLMAKSGFEHGQTEGLGWMDASVVPIPRHASLKIPHMGWNNLHIKRTHPMLEGVAEGEDVYFVHSYFMDTAESETVCATVEYGVSIPALVIKENMIGMQFHPEKSQRVGLHLLTNFLGWSY